MRYFAVRRRLCRCVALTSFILLAGAVGDASTLDDRLERLGRRIEKAIKRRSGSHKPRGLLSLAPSLSTTSPARAVLAQLKSSSLVDFEDRSTSRELLILLGQAADDAAAQPPPVQDDRYERIRQRLQGVGYDYWVLLSDQSDLSFVRVGAHVVHGELGCKGDNRKTPECFSTADYLEVEVPYAVVAAEQFAIGVSVGGIRRSVDQTTFGIGSNGVLARFPTAAEMDQSVIIGSAEVPRIRFELAFVDGDSLTAEGNPTLDGEQREYSAELETIPFRARRVGVLLRGAVRDITESVRDERDPSALEATASFTTLEANVGIVYGNLLNGVTLSAFGLRGEAEDRSPAREFFGLPRIIWEEEGEGFELRARRTTHTWELDFRARRFLTTREFNREYFPALGEAEIEGVGLRAELGRRWRLFGVSGVWSRSELDYADSGSLPSAVRVLSAQTDMFVALNLSVRLHPF